MTIMEQLAEAIKTADESRYAIHKATGISQTILHRIVKGIAGCSVETLDTLCEHLNLELVRKKRGN